MQEKLIVASPYLWAFPSDRTPKATKVVNVHLFIHGNNSCKLYQRLLVKLYSYYVCLHCATCVDVCRWRSCDGSTPFVRNDARFLTFLISS